MMKNKKKELLQKEILLSPLNIPTVHQFVRRPRL